MLAGLQRGGLVQCPPLLLSILAKSRAEKSTILYFLFSYFLSDFPNWGPQGSEGKHFCFHSGRSSTYPLDTFIVLLPYMIKTFKSGEGKMSGLLMYLVAFRSGKWLDGRRPTNTHLIKIYLCISQTDTISRKNTPGYQILLINAYQLIHSCDMWHE